MIKKWRSSGCTVLQQFINIWNGTLYIYCFIQCHSGKTKQKATVAKQGRKRNSWTETRKTMQHEHPPGDFWTIPRYGVRQCKDVLPFLCLIYTSFLCLIYTGRHPAKHKTQATIQDQVSKSRSKRSPKGNRFCVLKMPDERGEHPPGDFWTIPKYGVWQYILGTPQARLWNCRSLYSGNPWLWIPTMSCLTSQCFENALLPAAPLCYGIGQVDKRTVLADGVWYVVCEISGIKVLKLDTYQGRLSPSPNHCTKIAPLIVASCLQEAKSFLWSWILL